ncbi:MAG TPA: phenylacetate--CoA ligase [Smithellaceae bacterium]|nr:phenylacetate--CoA ligase [Smithellaceae bacterium]HQG80235.1 phenylacetate--CoA ligase [Smithellaceae bacterium]
MIYNEEFETLPREALKALQLKRLQQTLQRAYHTIGYYKRSLSATGVSPQDVISLDNLRNLPFTTREDVRKNYPFGLFSVPMSNIVRLHATTGTSGRSSVFSYTRRDIDTWTELNVRSLVAAGVTKNDIVHNAFSYGLLPVGLGVHYGTEKIGASVIPMSDGNTKRQITLLQDFGPTVLCSTPSYALHLAHEGESQGVNMKTLQLRVGIFGGELWSDATRDAIEDAFSIRALNIFGISEIMEPGIACECLEGRHGMHIFEDHFLVETINPQTGEVLPEGDEGELVFTSLTKEAFPLIRYRSGDISRLITEPCRCGRTHVRMERVLKRCDDMLTIRGINIFPGQVEAILQEIEGVSTDYQLIIDKAGALDTVELHVEVGEKYFAEAGGVKELQAIEKRIVKDMKDYLSIPPRVKLVAPQTLAQKKAKVIDKRII